MFKRTRLLLSVMMVLLVNVLSSRRRCVVHRKLSYSRHEDRQKMALESGATAVVAERGQKVLPRCVKFSVANERSA